MTGWEDWASELMPLRAWPAPTASVALRKTKLMPRMRMRTMAREIMSSIEGEGGR